MVAISNKRLHSWLMTIPVDNLKNESSRETLYLMQERMAEVIYAWMAREGIPEDLREEQEQNLPPETRVLYAGIEDVKDAVELSELAHARIDELEEKINALETFWVENVAEHIDKRQQKQFKSWIKVIGDVLIKRNDGDYESFQKELKQEFDFPSYRLIDAADFPRIQGYCQERFHRLMPPGTPLPDSLELEIKKLL
jgi:hypothetical protein